MTEPDPPLLVLVHGPPASGKTTVAAALARELGLPLFAKDEIKEELYESLGADDPDESRRLGAAVYPLLFLIARQELDAGRPLVLEANFVAGASEAEFSHDFRRTDSSRCTASHPRTFSWSATSRATATQVTTITCAPTKCGPLFALAAIHRST